jgi:hypothetical protein
MNILSENVKKVGAREGTRIEFLSIHAKHRRNVAVCTFMPASTVRVGRKLGILASLPTRSVNDRTTGNAPTVRV